MNLHSKKVRESLGLNGHFGTLNAIRLVRKIAQTEVFALKTAKNSIDFSRNPRGFDFFKMADWTSSLDFGKIILDGIVYPLNYNRFQSYFHNYATVCNWEDDILKF